MVICHLPYQFTHFSKKNKDSMCFETGLRRTLKQISTSDMSIGTRDQWKSIEQVQIKAPHHFFTPGPTPPFEDIKNCAARAGWFQSCPETFNKALLHPARWEVFADLSWQPPVKQHIRFGWTAVVAMGEEANSADQAAEDSVHCLACNPSKRFGFHCLKHSAEALVWK